MDVQLSIPNDLWLEVKKAAEEKRVSVQEWLRTELKKLVSRSEPSVVADLPADQFVMRADLPPQNLTEDEIAERLAWLKKPGVQEKIRTELLAQMKPDVRQHFDALNGILSSGMTDDEIKEERYQYLKQKHG